MKWAVCGPTPGTRISWWRSEQGMVGARGQEVPRWASTSSLRPPEPSRGRHSRGRPSLPSRSRWSGHRSLVLCQSTGSVPLVAHRSVPASSSARSAALNREKTPKYEVVFWKAWTTKEHLHPSILSPCVLQPFHFTDLAFFLKGRREMRTLLHEPMEGALSLGIANLYPRAHCREVPCGAKSVCGSMWVRQFTCAGKWQSFFSKSAAQTRFDKHAFARVRTLSLN